MICYLEYQILAADSPSFREEQHFRYKLFIKCGKLSLISSVTQEAVLIEKDYFLRL